MSQKILIFSETYNETLKAVSFEILSQIRALVPSAIIEVALFNFAPEKAVSDLQAWGVEKIHLIKGTHLTQYSPEGYAQALCDLIKTEKYHTVFSGATSLAKDLLPRLSGKLLCPMASEIVQLKFEGEQFLGIRPMFAGKVLCQVSFPKASTPAIISVRPNSFSINSINSPAPQANPPTVVEHQVAPLDMKAVIKEIIKSASQKLDLTEAKIIVSGGRAMKNSDNFKILDELANAIGATVGASRAAVDAGYAPHSMQVGQTGKTVSPTLYIACGISGAIQHLAGMRTSKYIVAINTDPDAPIFSKADYGIVGDLFEVVPALTKACQELH